MWWICVKYLNLYHSNTIKKWKPQMLEENIGTSVQNKYAEYVKSTYK